MLLICAHCQTPAAGTDRCPQCGHRLAAPADTPAPVQAAGKPPPDLVQPTAVGRLLLGVVAGLGLAVGLRDWAAAGLLLLDEGPASAAGQALAGGVKLLAATVAGLLAGTGRPKGGSAGLLAGLIVAGMFLVHDRAAGGRGGLIDVLTLVGLAVAGAAAGTVGSRRWPPPADLPPPPAPQGSSLAGLVQTGPKGPSERPLRWGRILVGGLIAAAGIALADPARMAFKRGAAGAVGAGGTSLVTVVDLEIAALFVMLGGAAAGAATGVGARHGVLAGLTGGLLTVWMPAAGVKSVFPVVEGLLKVLGLPTSDLAGPGAAFNLLLACLAVAAFGGWLGGTLLPPVIPADKVKKRLAYS